MASSQSAAVVLPVAKEATWARLISNVLSPPVGWMLVAFVIAGKVSPTIGEAVRWGGTYALVASLLPLLFVAWLLRTGRVSDLHIKDRRERLLPYLFASVCAALATWLLWRFDAPMELVLIALISFCQLAVMLFVNFVWQISMHTMSITGITMALTFVYGIEAGMLATPFIVIVALARLQLRRHTPIQLIGGVIVGILTPMIVLLLI